ncbi:hypothetical protein K491DRAFT_721586 [Lophiostoma macrostomum CBS 122681]|uniref:Rhodopsin domain-containing protein n=1 Tax=Lophiostoma macrostomum CBS 122681 TaxID=1314788 RepID=A0A6A6SNX0_9PLEO|nr:hypothetical protein K491DRAFT_721586 [Lophiostoma macrostomum CBS 122681]
MAFHYTGMIVPASDHNFRIEIGRSARVSLTTTKALVYTLSALAFITFFTRLIIRLVTLRKLQLDDAFLVLAVSCLTGCVIIISKYAFVFYLANAKVHYPELTRVTFPLFNQNLTALYADMLEQYKVLRNVLALLSWTIIYAVKMCFFTFMYPMIRQLPRLRLYWWVSVTLSAVAWFFSAFKTFFLPEENSSSMNVSFTTAMGAADIITDVIVVSIPILLLWDVKMRTRTKVSVIAFLSLSAFMIVCSFIRVVGFIGPNGHTPDTTWRMLWTQIECCIAVIMASLTAVRTLFVAANTHASGEREWKWDRRRFRFVRRHVPAYSSTERSTPRQMNVVQVRSRGSSRTSVSDVERRDAARESDCSCEPGFGDPKNEYPENGWRAY